RSAATAWTRWRGSTADAAHAATAIAVCTANAAAAPTHTGSGASRVDRTSVAMKVLSGSSDGKIAAKTVRATTTFTTAWRVQLRQLQRERTSPADRAPRRRGPRRRTPGR